MTTREIIKQRFDGETQRKDCFLCCAAMATGYDYEGAWRRIGEDLQAVVRAEGPQSKDCDRILAALGWSRIDSAHAAHPTTEPGDYFVLFVLPEYASIGFLRNILWGRRALIQVRSKNYVGEMHIVYWDGRKLFDPTNLRDYTWPEVEPIYLWLFDEAATSPIVREVTRGLLEQEG